MKKVERKDWLEGLVGTSRTNEILLLVVLSLLITIVVGDIACQVDADCRNDVCVNSKCVARPKLGKPCTNDDQCFDNDHECLSNVCVRRDPRTLVWDQWSDFPGGIVLAAGGVYNNKLYAFGGADFTIPAFFSAKLRIFDIATNTWTVSPNPMPYSTTRHSATLIGDFFYIAGGYDGSSASNLFYKYDPSTDTYMRLADLLVPRQAHAAVAYGTILVLISGGSQADPVSDNPSVDYFDTANPGNGWNTIPNVIMPPLIGLTAVVSGTKIIVAGGFDSDSDSNTTPGVNARDTVTIIDVPTKTVTAGPKLNRVRYYHHTFAGDDGKVYVVQGTASNSYLAPEMTIEVLNPSDAVPKWTLLPSPLLYGHVAGFMGQLGNRFFFIGGIEPNRGFAVTQTESWDYKTNVFTPYDKPPVTLWKQGASDLISGLIVSTGGRNSAGLVTAVQKFDTKTNTWLPGPFKPLPVGTLDPGSGAVGTKLIVSGGSNLAGDTILPNTQVYDSPTDTWTTGANMPIPVSGHCCAVFRKELFCFGGAYIDQNSQFVLNDKVQAYNPTTNTWRLVPDVIPFPTAACSATLYKSVIYITGGLGLTDNVFEATGQIQAFFPFTGTWDTTTVFPTISNRAFHQTAYLNGYLMITGGTPDQQYEIPTSEAYDPLSNTLITLPNASTAMGYGKAVKVGRSVYYIGQTREKLYSTINKVRAPPF